MTAALNHTARVEANREKNLVALSSVLAAVLLTGMKLAVGWWTDSLGLLAEAAHSGLDLVAAIVTLVAVRAAARPADPDHTYGHGKVENLSALFETALLLATCVWIIWEAVQRLFYEDVTVAVNVWAFVVMTISIVVDFSRSRALKRVADKYQSQALEADALHFSTDIWSSVVVLFGLGFVVAAQHWDLPWLARADAVAALGVAVIVVWVSIQLGRKSVNDLLDAVSPAVRDDVARAARVEGVLHVDRVRVRRSGPEAFADITLSVDRATSLERAHEIATASEAAIAAALPGADVVIHVEPVGDEEAGVLGTTHRLAARHGLGAHGIRVLKHKRGYSLELHLEVNEALNVGKAHELADAFEEDLRRALPGLQRVVTHLEPAGESAATRRAVPVNEKHIHQALEELAREGNLRCQFHDLEVQRVAGELSVSFHCSLDANAKIGAAHLLTERVEKALRAKVPGLGRVVIHVEPRDAPGPAAAAPRQGPPPGPAAGGTDASS